MEKRGARAGERLSILSQLLREQLDEAVAAAEQSDAVVFALSILSQLLR
jgi:hypothetical protein